jgi:hypothetical protein
MAKPETDRNRAGLDRGYLQKRLPQTHLSGGSQRVLYVGTCRIAALDASIGRIATLCRTAGTGEIAGVQGRQGRLGVRPFEVFR